MNWKRLLVLALFTSVVAGASFAVGYRSGFEDGAYYVLEELRNILEGSTGTSI